MQNEICHYCNGGAFDPLLQINNNTAIVKCRRCKLARTYPYPQFNFESQEKYSKFYLDNEQMFRMFAKSMLDAIKEYKCSGSFLDIGCAVGYVLDEAGELGFDNTNGIELNLDAAAIAKSKGHNVYTQPIEKLNLQNEKFDLIIFNHVLEHVLDMRLILSEIKKVLKKDGIIYCGMPNYNSIMQKLLKKNWYGWGMPDHIWHFDKLTFPSVMENNGFTSIKIVQNGMYYPYSRSLRKNTRATIARIADKLGLGDQVYGVFSKANS